MLTTILRGFLFTGLSLLWGGLAQAQCPPGMYPFQFAPNQPASCAPIPGSGNQQAPQPSPPQWERRWGAIAADVPKGFVGTVTDLPSKSQAQRAALADCAAKGGSACKLQSTYDNECISMVVGSKVFNIAAGDTQNTANQSAMQTCSATGDPSCRVYYSACSLPVRIR